MISETVIIDQGLQGVFHQANKVSRKQVSNMLKVNYKNTLVYGGIDY